MPPRFESTEVTLAPPCLPEDLEWAAAFGVGTAAARDPGAWQLRRDAGRLVMLSPDVEGPMRLELRVDEGPLAQRLRTARRGDALPRAVGLPRRQAPPRVVDATAGLGRDAMVLAHLGCDVTAVERVPALALLLAAAAAGAPFAPRFRVVAADAVAWLAALPEHARPDAVCLDPMFEQPGRAQVKKEMQVLRALAGPPADVAALFAAAAAAARERVVVKRHPSHAPLAPSPSFTVGGERVRFDVYLLPARAR